MPPTGRARPGTLAAARAAIPDRCRQRSTARGLGWAVGDATIYAALLVALVLADKWWMEVPLIALAGLAVGALFILGHDASHGTLTANDRLNRIAARLLMLPSLHLAGAWDLGHNRIHHGYTTQQGMDFVWHPTTPEEYRAMGAAARLRHRLEWSWIGAGAYYGRAVWWRKMMRFRPPRKRAAEIRRDRGAVIAAATLALSAAAALGWWRAGTVPGALWMACKLVIAPFLVFTQVIGWTVYVHHVAPHLRWSPRRHWTPWHAQVEATTILHLPRWLNVASHNIFVHVPHHVDTRIPWYHLQEAAAALRSEFPDAVGEAPLRLRDYWRSTRRCKLYEFHEQRWVTYAAATEGAKMG